MKKLIFEEPREVKSDDIQSENLEDRDFEAGDSRENTKEKRIERKSSANEDKNPLQRVSVVQR